MNPTLPDTVRAQLVSTFRAETIERLHEMSASEEAAVELQQALPMLLRHAHSIKGAAAAVGRTDVAELAHALEDRLGAARQDPSSLAWDDVAAMLDDLAAVVDARDDPEAAAAGADGHPGDQDAGGRRPSGNRSSGSGRIVRIATDDLERVAADVGDLARLARSWQRLAAEVGALGRRSRRERRAESRAGATRLSDDLASLAWLAQRQSHGVDQLVDSLRDNLEGLLTESADELLTAAAREARRLARHLEHPVDIEVHGVDVRADRDLLDRLRDPLLHLVRNAVDHGFGDATSRRDRGKPAALTVHLTARLTGSSFVLEVSDDGRGIDVDAVRARAAAEGVDEDEAGRLRDTDVLGLVFRAGLSTAPDVTEVSGRGVGLAAVREEVEALHGTVSLESTTGVGTTFRIEVPHGVAGIRCVVADVGELPVAVPVTAVRRIVSLTRTPPATIGGRATLLVDGTARPLVPGRALFPDHTGTARFAIVIEHAGRTCALAVDGLRAQVDLVVRPLPSILGPTPAFSGGAVVDGGAVVPVLLPSWAIDRDLVWMAGDAVTDPVRPPARILVVDDSLTTRTLLRTILAAAGFAVDVATDGMEAYQQARTGDYDLVVTDLEMPRLDGWALTRAIRADPAVSGLPVIVVSGRSSDGDREESARAGADVHLGKGTFDQGRLVEAVRQLLP